MTENIHSLDEKGVQELANRMFQLARDQEALIAKPGFSAISQAAFAYYALAGTLRGKKELGETGFNLSSKLQHNRLWTSL